MVKIRLSRSGKKGYNTFRIIVVNAREKRETKALEILGWYNPHIKEGKRYDVEADRVKYWLGVGAQPTETVRRILIKEGVVAKPLTTKIFSRKPGRKSIERAEARAAKEAAAKEAAAAPAESETSE